MKHIALAVAAMAFAPFALAAEGQGDNTGDKQPTMAELQSKIDGVSGQVSRLATTLGTMQNALAGHAITLNTLSSTITANHTTIVGKFAPQVAVVMSVPQWYSGFNGGASENFNVSNPRLYLVGSSTIAGFPNGTVAADGRLTDATLPIGTYLFELQQPYGDRALCSGELSRRHLAGTAARYKAAYPSMRLHPYSNRTRLEDGFGIYAYTAPASFRLNHKWPSGLKFTGDTTLAAADRASAKAMSSYTGAVKITKLK